jgi:hypothetical protein
MSHHLAKIITIVLFIQKQKNWPAHFMSPNPKHAPAACVNGVMIYIIC